jgi:lipopolysaccharide biosynthesis regulator YciM
MRAESIALAVAIFLIVVGAAGIIWNWLRARRRGRIEKRMPAEYFQAVSYLLNEETDRALATFIQLADRDSDMIELHFALGSLFRRKGEFERAARIHQNLIARPALSHDQHETALRELGQDYLRAGLYDRAERIFADLLEAKGQPAFAARQLVTIYEQQQDWPQAAEMRRKLEKFDGHSERHIIAQYYCELVELARARDDAAEEAHALAEARRNAKDLPRVRLLWARSAAEHDNTREAVREYQQLLGEVPDLAEVVLPPFAAVYGRGAREPDFDALVRRLLDSSRETNTPLAVAGLKHPRLRASAAMFDAIERELVVLVKPLSERAVASFMDSQEVRTALIRLLTDWVAQRPLYLCRVCGFRTQALYWHCPGCRNWDTMRMRADVFPEPEKETTPSE